jgi:hypothetical protein
LAGWLPRPLKIDLRRASAVSPVADLDEAGDSDDGDETGSGDAERAAA